MFKKYIRGMQSVHDAVSGVPQKKLKCFIRMSAPEQRLLELQNAKVRCVVHMQTNYPYS